MHNELLLKDLFNSILAMASLIYISLCVFFGTSKFEPQTETHEFWTNYYLCYNSYDFPLPLNVQNNQTSKEFFDVQPENVERPIMANTPFCGNVRIVENGTLTLPFPHGQNNVTHLCNTKSAPQQGEITEKSLDYALILIGHEGYSFQHFLDNTAVNLGLAVDAIRYAGIPLNHISIITEKSSANTNVREMWNRMPFKEILDYGQYRRVTAKHLIYVECVPRMHPDFTSTLRELIRIEHDPNPNTIFFIIRKPSNSRNHNRFVQNNDEVIQLLEKMYGSNLYLFDHSKHSFEEILPLFAKAKAIIGIHGGGMYNQFFASSQASVIELMPIGPNGIYPGQTYLPVPSFAHMAMWIDANMIGQRFWRYYQISDTMNCNVDIANFSTFLLKIPELQKYLNISYLKQSEELIGNITELVKPKVDQNSKNELPDNSNDDDSQTSMPINPNRSLKVLVLHASGYKPFYPTWLTLAFYLAIFIYFSYIHTPFNYLN